MPKARPHKELGLILRARRELLGLAQADVARAAGRSRAAVGQWESGETAPSRSIARAVAAVLGIDLGTIQPLIPESIEPVDSATFSRTVPLMDMAELIRGESGAGHPRVTVAGDLPEDSVALRVCDASMAPEFAEGDLVVVSRSILPISGDAVIAEVEGEGLLRIYQSRGLDSHGKPVFDLLSTSADHDTITCNSSNGHKVLAVVMAHWKTRKR